MRKSISMVVSLVWIVCAGYPTRSNVGANHIYYGSHEEQQAYTASDYVQDGLVAMWDGIENAGWGVHDNNATVWKDLVGTQDMVLSQFGSFSDDSLVCAGGGYAASRGALFADFIYAEAVVEYDSLERQNGNIVIWGEYSGMTYYSASMDLFIYNDTLIQTGGSNVFYEKPNIRNLILQYTRPYSSDVFARANGVNLTRYAKVDNWATRYGIGFFGGRQSGYSYRGKIKRVAMYSRIPTAAEIAANYAIDKVRFNVP